MPIERKPKFNGRFTKMTAEGEQLEVVFSAADEGELRTALKHAAKVAEDRMTSQNEKVIQSGEMQRENMRQLLETAKREIEPELRRRLKAEIRQEMGLAPEEETDGVAASGPTHLRADP